MTKITEATLTKEAKEVGVKPSLYIDWARYNNFIFTRNKGDKTIKYNWDGATHSIKGLKVEIHFVNNQYLELQIDKNEDLELVSMRLFPFSEENASMLFVVMIAIIENYIKNTK